MYINNSLRISKLYDTVKKLYSYLGVCKYMKKEKNVMVQTKVNHTFDDDEKAVKILITKIKNGNQTAFSELVNRYRSQVAAIAYKLVMDFDEAADITQDVFVKMSKNIHKYDESKKFYTWLYRITVNTSIDFMRKNKRHRHEPLEHALGTSVKDQNSPDQSYNRERIQGYINSAADTLNDKQKSAFLLRDVKGSKISEVADIMDMPEATVRWYLHRARTKIKKELVRNCPHLLIMFGLK